MFVGHAAAALALKRAEKRLNLGALLGAAMGLDILLWIFVLAGAESVAGAADFSARHYFTFVFPYSHGLAAALLWAHGAGLGTWLILGPRFEDPRGIVGAMSLGVFSHFILDALVHVPDLPLWGNASPKIGLGLWRNMPAALTVEMLLSAGALILFLSGPDLSRKRKAAAAALTILLAVMTAAGPYAARVPPVKTMAAVSLAACATVVLLGFWIEGRIGLLGVSRETAS